MSEPFLERLSRFTPDPGALDRDALLYAAGRCSARPNRKWIALTAALAVTQVLSLGLLWPRPEPFANRMAQPVAELPRPAPSLEPSTEATDSPGVWSARTSLLESETADRPAPGGTGTFIESGPPLRVSDPLPASISN